MLLSFPIGTYLVFNSNIGDNITYEYPLNGLDLFFGGINYNIPLSFELGDGFIVCWCIFLIIFSLSIVGPRQSFFKAMTPIMTIGKKNIETNYLVVAITWFSILILFSGITNYLQEGIGITTIPPKSENRLLQFFDVTKAPLIEELGFRLLLIGLPLYAFYSHKSSVRHFLKSLWRPDDFLHIYDKRKPLILIVIVAVFFGLAHIISGESWSEGKFAQATISGIILGWIYYKHGLAPALLIHWATNYFIFSYVFVIAEINDITIQNAFSHSLVNTMEILFVILGVISISILILTKYFSKKQKLEV